MTRRQGTIQGAARDLAGSRAARSPLAVVGKPSRKAVAERLVLVAAAVPADVRASAPVQALLLRFAEASILAERISLEIARADIDALPKLVKVATSIDASLVTMARALKICPQQDSREAQRRARHEAQFRAGAIDMVSAPPPSGPAPDWAAMVQDRDERGGGHD